MAGAWGSAGRSVAASVVASGVGVGSGVGAGVAGGPDTVIVTVTVFDHANPSETR